MMEIHDEIYHTKIDPKYIFAILYTYPESKCITLNLKIPGTGQLSTFTGTRDAAFYFLKNSKINWELERITINLTGFVCTLSAMNDLPDRAYMDTDEVTVKKLREILDIDEEDLIQVNAWTREMYIKDEYTDLMVINSLHYSSDIVNDGTVDNYLMQQLHHSTGLIVFTK